MCAITERVLYFVCNAGGKVCQARKAFHAAQKRLLVSCVGHILNLNKRAGYALFLHQRQRRNNNYAHAATGCFKRKFFASLVFRLFIDRAQKRANI